MAELAYGFKKSFAGTVADIEPRVREALKAEGFGVLTEIDVAATFAAKLEVDFPPYKILGACNPSLAHAALQEERDIGLLLPCNVVVYEAAAGETVVSVIDPVEQLSVSGRAELAGFADEVAERMKRVLDAV